MRLDDVLDRAVSLDHDFRAYRHALGEPELVEDFLVYVSGSRIAISSLPIPGVETSAAEATRAAVRRFGADEVLHLGPESLAPTLAPLGFRTERAQPPDPEFVELAADPEAMLRGDHARKAKSSARRFEIVARSTVTAEHRALADAMAASRPVARQDLALWSKLADVAAEPGMLLLEARAGPDLAGFVLVDTAFLRADLYVLGFFAEGASGASDALHLAMARRAARSGKERVNLGYALNEGLLAYKRKWRGEPVASPPWIEHFVREGREATFRSWELVEPPASGRAR